MAKRIIKSKKFIFLLAIFICFPFLIIFLTAPRAEMRQGCCSWHGGVCGCQCCDGTPLSATCAPYYPSCSTPYTPATQYTPPSPTIEYKNVTATEIIPFSTENEEDASLEEGQTKVKQDGVNGIKTITYKITYTDGTETSREKISEEVTKQPTDKIEVKGTKPKTETGQADNTNIVLGFLILIGMFVGGYFIYRKIRLNKKSNNP